MRPTSKRREGVEGKRREREEQEEGRDGEKKKEESVVRLGTFFYFKHCDLHSWIYLLNWGACAVTWYGVIKSFLALHYLHLTTFPMEPYYTNARS